MLKADFHVHTLVSRDAAITPEELVKRAKELGINVIAVTNHNSVEGGKGVEAFARKHFKELVVFRGSEIRTKGGEIIALNLKKDITEKMGLLETCRLAKEQGAFIIVPHLFDRFRKGIGNSISDIIEYVDAIEGFNSRTLFDSFNAKSVSFARENRIPMVAGSDAHFIEEFGKAYTLVDSGPKRSEIIKAIREGKTEIIGEKSGLRPHWKTFLRNIGLR